VKERGQILAQLSEDVVVLRRIAASGESHAARIGHNKIDWTFTNPKSPNSAPPGSNDLARKFGKHRIDSEKLLIGDGLICDNFSGGTHGRLRLTAAVTRPQPINYDFKSRAPRGSVSNAWFGLLSVAG
jgi:hypothetical protein